MFISRHVLLLLWCGPPGIIPIRRGRRARCQKSIYKLFVYKKPQCISLPVWAEYGRSMPFLAHLPGRPVRMTLYSLHRNVCFFDKLYVWHRINRISRNHNLFCCFAYAQSAYRLACAAIATRYAALPVLSRFAQYAQAPFCGMSFPRTTLDVHHQ